MTHRLRSRALLLPLAAVALTLSACAGNTAGQQPAVTDADATASDDAGDASDDDTSAGLGTVSVIIRTSKGDITVALDGDAAPITVTNFLAYVDKGHYDGLLFHRVIDDFMIQGGGLLPDGSKKPTDAPIKNEATNGLKNLRGTIAMARTSVIDSATSQFFINLKDNAFLDHTAETQKGFGYAVFGKVTAGQEVVDAIGKVDTTGKQGSPADKPLTDILITSITRK